MMIGLRTVRPSSIHTRCRAIRYIRALSTLPNNPHIYYFRDPSNPSHHLLTYLASNPPNQTLAIGRTPTIPPEPSTFKENQNFLHILQSVLAEHAIDDQNVKAQAYAYASPAGVPVKDTMSPNRPSPSRSGPVHHAPPAGSGAGPTSSQAGHGGGGRGGWVHVYDLRHPPDFGRIPDPEDIFGSVEVDGKGQFVEETVDLANGKRRRGNYQESGTYRIVTRDGILGLSEFLREKLIQTLKQMEK